MRLPKWVVTTCVVILLAQGVLAPVAMSASGEAMPADVQTDQLASAASEVVDLLTRLSSLQHRKDPDELKTIYAALSVRRPSVIERSLASYRCEALRLMERREEVAEIARMEKNRGNKELALRALFKAVYTWHEYAEQAKHVAVRVFREDRPQQTPGPQPKMQRDMAVTIAALYTKVNLHPMVLAMLERYEKDTGEDLPEKTRIRAEWQDLLGKIASGKRHDRYILGQKVSEVQDWAKIPIPRPTGTFWK